MKRTLNINELDVTDQPVIYTCHGLGSCVGLFISDRTSGLSGGAHIPLADGSAGLFHDASDMIKELLIRFREQGSTLQTLRAKFTGGANVYASTYAIGEQNVKTVFRNLVENRIFIAAYDVGGACSRTAHYDTQSAMLTIKMSDQKLYQI